MTDNDNQFFHAMLFYIFGVIALYGIIIFIFFSRFSPFSEVRKVQKPSTWDDDTSLHQPETTDRT